MPATSDQPRSARNEVRRALAPPPNRTRGGGTPATALAVARAGWGSALLAAPGVLIRVLGGHDARIARMTLRVLGLRHLVQAAVVGRRPPPAARRVGAVVDLLHASSAAVVAVVDRRQRRVGLADAAIAATWGLLGWCVPRRFRPPWTASGGEDPHLPATAR